MVVITTPDGYSFYMDDWLSKALDITKKELLKDDDAVLIIDGPERSGKSVLAMQVAKKVDPTFCIDRMCISSEQFINALNKAEKGQAVVFDESFRGLASSDSYAETNKLLVSKMMEMGQKNLFVLIVMPTFFLLRTYVAVFRSRGLLHVYRQDNERGRWSYFSSDRKKALYIYGKKTLSYTGNKFPKLNRRGRFLDQYTIPEKEYRQKKEDEFNRSEVEAQTKNQKFTLHLHERNILIRFLKEKEGMNWSEVEDLLNILGIKVKSLNALQKTIENTEKVFLKKESKDII